LLIQIDDHQGRVWLDDLGEEGPAEWSLVIDTYLLGAENEFEELLMMLEHARQLILPAA